LGLCKLTPLLIDYLFINMAIETILTVTKAVLINSNGENNNNTNDNNDNNKNIR